MMSDKNIRIVRYLPRAFKASLFVAAAFFICLPAASAQTVTDPCPMPKELASESPPDMATVQSDIDILKLCVERANLLSELNDLVMETEGVDKDDKNAMPVTGKGGGKSAPNFDSGNVQPVDAELFDLPEGQEKPENKSASTKKTISDIPDRSDQVEQEQQSKSKEKPYRITNIFGNTSSGIIAELLDPEGGLVRAQEGDILDNGAVVTRISLRGVVIQKDGEENQLQWR